MLSGSSFYVNNTNGFELEGISASSENRNYKADKFIYFTKLRLYVDWIKAIIGTEWNYIDLECDDVDGS